MSRTTLVLACLLSACTGTTRENERTIEPETAPIAPFTESWVTTYDQPPPSQNHVMPCNELTLNDVPPVGGDHYSMWAAIGSYDAPIPWGFLIHAMEHGTVVLAYDCPQGCADVVAELEAVAAARVDPLCRSEDFMARFIVVPMTDFGAAIGALAWGHAYLASTLDPPSLLEWIDAHYAMGRENLCGGGVDQSAVGWCP